MFKKAFTGYTVTENGMPTPKESGSKLVDLFFKMGAMRNANESEIESMFAESFKEDPLYTLRAMFYNRDIRGGQGERRFFRVCLKWLATNQPELALRFLPFVPEFGRWDDLFVLEGTLLERNAYNWIGQALAEKNALCAKWMPREGKKNHKLALKLMGYFGLTAREYRKLLAGNTQVVETKMCHREWGAINYSHVPSVASNKYRQAFYKRDGERYAQWIEDVKKGKSKVNASAIFPSDIVHMLLNNDLYIYTSPNKTIIESAQIQWNALPNYVPEGKSFIPVCDVSGSMSGQPLEVCLALGIYLAERNKGPFENLFFTFSGSPTLEEIKGKNLWEKVQNLNKAHWQMNTDLEALFRYLLTTAVSRKIPQSEMPSAILIMSDMQFDQATRGSSNTAMEMIEEMYAKAGYKVPDVVFWNLRASNGVPVSYTKSGVALVSGYSPSIMKTVFSGEMTPLATVYRTLDQERYARITI